jgi:hypothetical protein
MSRLSYCKDELFYIGYRDRNKGLKRVFLLINFKIFEPMCKGKRAGFCALENRDELKIAELQKCDLVFTCV